MAAFESRRTTFVFPDYRQNCPVCGGSNCAIGHGSYTRVRVITPNGIYFDIVIVRYLCRRKGSHPKKARTFSLLPHWLVPYHQHSANFMVNTATELRKNHGSWQKTLNRIDQQFSGGELVLEKPQIFAFENLLKASFQKICATTTLKSQMVESPGFIPEDPVESLLDFVSHYSSAVQRPGLSKCEQLSFDFFYHFQTGDFFDRHFLLGTPFQKR